MAVRARVTPAQTERAARDEREIEAKFTLRLAKAMMEQIDTAIRIRPGKVSRNQWIIEAIAKSLHERGNDGRTAPE
jgi:predicted HicB family RNase H-like nuclease